MKTLRERIEELQRYRPGHAYMDKISDGGYLKLSDVETVAAEHEAEQTAVAIGVQPIVPGGPYLPFRYGPQPGSKCVAGCKVFSDGWSHHEDCGEVEAMARAAELPKWRQELERLAPEALKPGGLSAADRGRFIALDELETLRVCIERGQGEAVVPESVQRIAWPDVPLTKCTACWRRGDLHVKYPPFGNAAGCDPVTTEEMFIAIDKAGNNLRK